MLDDNDLIMTHGTAIVPFDWWNFTIFFCEYIETPAEYPTLFKSELIKLSQSINEIMALNVDLLLKLMLIIFLTI